MFENFIDFRAFIPNQIDLVGLFFSRKRSESWVVGSMNQFNIANASILIVPYADGKWIIMLNWYDSHLPNSLLFATCNLYLFHACIYEQIVHELTHWRVELSKDTWSASATDIVHVLSCKYSTSNWKPSGFVENDEKMGEILHKKKKKHGVLWKGGKLRAVSHFLIHSLVLPIFRYCHGCAYMQCLVLLILIYFYCVFFFCVQ